MLTIEHHNKKHTKLCSFCSVCFVHRLLVLLPIFVVVIEHHQILKKMNFDHLIYQISTGTDEISHVGGATEMPSVTFLQYFVLFFDENTSKILQDIEKYSFFSKFITTHVYCRMGGNTVFSFKIPFFSPKNTANHFARLATLVPRYL